MENMQIYKKYNTFLKIITIENNKIMIFFIQIIMLQCVMLHMLIITTSLAYVNLSCDSKHKINSWIVFVQFFFKFVFVEHSNTFKQNHQTKGLAYLNCWVRLFFRSLGSNSVPFLLLCCVDALLCCCSAVSFSYFLGIHPLFCFLFLLGAFFL